MAEDGEGDANAAQANAADVDEAQLRDWRFKCDLKRVATYYRVTGAQEKAEARERGTRTRARFRAWAASVLRERAANAAQGRAGANEQDGDRAGRKRPMQPGAYAEARAHKQRATAEEVARRRQRLRRRRLGPTAASTELGKRMRDDMSEVANKCRRQRRERFGDG